MAEWKVDVPDDILQSLAKEFAAGAIRDDGTRLLDEEVVATIDGLKVEIFANEHPPPHFRVRYQGDSNDFNICTGEPLYEKGLKKWRRTVRDWHRLNRSKLISWWNERRPGNCPVGEAKC